MKKLMIAGVMLVLGCVAMAAPQPGKPKPQPGLARPGQPNMTAHVTEVKPGARKDRVRRERRGNGERMTESEKRIEYIAKLEEKGRHALPQIAAYIGDRDEEVSEEAFRAWSHMVEDMDYQLRADAILKAADALRQSGYVGR